MGERIYVPEGFVAVDHEKSTGCGSCIILRGEQVFEMQCDKAAVFI